MAVTTRSSTGINGGYDVTNAQNTINYLKAVMVTGAKINASDVNSLISLWNSFNGHTHGLTDLWGLKEYGNTNPGFYYSLGYWYLDWAYRVQSGGLWGQTNWTTFESGQFTGPTQASVQSQYDALPATKNYTTTDAYGNPLTVTVPKSIVSGPAVATAFAYYATSPGNYDNRTTDGPNLSGDIGGAVIAGGVVTAAKVNELVNAMAGRANHSHTWYDRTGP